MVLGVPPTRPDTGYGYIERGALSARPRGVDVYVLQRFTEKPELKVAQEYAASGEYFWNAGMFFWRVSTFLDNLKRFLPATHGALFELGKSIGTKRYAGALRRIYPKLENISVDYAIMEPATRAEGAPRVSVIPAEIGWSDIGSWAAVYELLALRAGANVSAGPHLRSTPRAIFSGARRNLLPRSAFATWCWSKPMTRCCFALASARRTWAKSSNGWRKRKQRKLI